MNLNLAFFCSLAMVVCWFISGYYFWNEGIKSLSAWYIFLLSMFFGGLWGFFDKKNEKDKKGKELENKLDAVIEDLKNYITFNSILCLK